MMKKCKKKKLSFFVAENIVFIITALCCIAVLIHTYHLNCEITQNIIMSIATSVLASVLIPLGLNIGKIEHEKRVLNTTCESIINNSIFLIGRLNNYIAPMGKKPFSCYSDLKNNSTLSTVNFKDFENFDELFLLIPQKLNRIVNMDYLSTSDSFELIVKKLNTSIPAAVKEKNYIQLFRALTLAIGMMENIKSPIGTNDYIKRFDAGVKKSYEETEHIYFKNTDNYIIQCLENDLSERRQEKTEVREWP